MRKSKSKSGFGEMILWGVGIYGLYKVLGDNTPAIGQAIVPHYDLATGTESEEAKKKRIQNVIDAAKGYGIRTHKWKPFATGANLLMDCLNFVYNVLRDAGYRDINGEEIPRTRTNNMHKQTAFFDVITTTLPERQGKILDIWEVSKRIEIGDIVVFGQYVIKKDNKNIPPVYPDDYAANAGHAVLITSGSYKSGYITREMPGGENGGPIVSNLTANLDHFNLRILSANDLVHCTVLRPNQRLIKGYYLNKKNTIPQYLHGQIV